jgi:phosphoenolpyruvate-protein phosphotransferase (PTS system enzyme I)
MQTSDFSTETRLTGLPISGGIVVGKVCRFNENRHSNLAVYRVSGDGVSLEKNRVRRAIDLATDQLSGLIEDVAERIGSAEAKIFEAQKAILGDSVLSRRIFEDIETAGFNAESAVTRVLDNYELRLLEVDNEYIKERASDIGELRRRLLDVLGNTNPSLQCGNESHCQRGRNRIIATGELTAGMTVELDADQTIGFVTERGGPTSHAAILARALGIPAVSGVKGVHNLLSCGTELLLNGNTGEVVAWPREETIARARSEQAAVVTTATVVEPVAELTVLANINHASEVDDAVAHKSEGIGLYRTEFEFLSAGKILDEEEQYERYASVVKAMAGRRVSIRLLDIGGDKQFPLFGLPREDNPYLGLRGSRLLLERSDLLRPQARALVRASAHGPVDVLYPMIVELEQFVKLKRLFGEAVDDLAAGDLRHGVMFEVPSACLEARRLLEVADFGSIGTNDLVQYLFAVDRNNELVAHDYTPDRPVFWSVLEQIVAAAAQTDRTVSICGEAAGNLQFLPRLMQMGLTTLSVSPRLIAGLRLAARQKG